MAIKINVIIPTFNASGTIQVLVEQLEKELSLYDLRILLVDDASGDDTREIIQALAQEYDNIEYSFMPKNQGQQASLLRGLRMISEPCDYVVTMDDDLQNPVKLIHSLIEMIQSGYDIVYAVPVLGAKEKSSAPSLIRRVGSRFRDLLFDSFSGKPRGIKVSAFRIMTFALAVKAAKSKKRFFYLSAEIFQYRDIRAENIMYEYVPRPRGHSGYGFGKLLRIYIKILLSYKLNWL